jgi:hypothetical protein
MGYLRDLGLGLLATEIYVHASPLARWIVAGAVARLPDEERERRREEWLADLDDMPGAIEKLLWALGCHWAATVTNVQAWRGSHPHGVRATIERWNNWINALPLRKRIFVTLLLFVGGGVLGGSGDVMFEGTWGACACYLVGTSWWRDFILHAAILYVAGNVAGAITYLIYRLRRKQKG